MINHKMSWCIMRSYEISWPQSWDLKRSHEPNHDKSLMLSDISGGRASVLNGVKPRTLIVIALELMFSTTRTVQAIYSSKMIFSWRLTERPQSWIVSFSSSNSQNWKLKWNWKFSFWTWFWTIFYPQISCQLSVQWVCCLQ